MDVRSIDSRPTERLITSWINRDIRTTNGLEDASGVVGGVLQRCIAVDCRDAQEVQGWMMGGNQDSKCILRSSLGSHSLCISPRGVGTHIMAWVVVVSNSKVRMRGRIDATDQDRSPTTRGWAYLETTPL